MVPLVQTIITDGINSADSHLIASLVQTVISWHHWCRQSPLMELLVQTVTSHGTTSADSHN